MWGQPRWLRAPSQARCLDPRLPHGLPLTVQAPPSLCGPHSLHTPCPCALHGHCSLGVARLTEVRRSTVAHGTPPGPSEFPGSMKRAAADPLPPPPCSSPVPLPLCRQHRWLVNIYQSRQPPGRCGQGRSVASSESLETGIRGAALPLAGTPWMIHLKSWGLGFLF